MTEAPVGRTANILGYMGVLPQLAAVGWVALGNTEAVVIATAYPLLILSFLGGTWWGLAMRDSAPHDEWMIVGVLPSLIALALGVAAILSGGSPWSLVAIGVVILLTLPVDRALANGGLAPTGWMALRIPLSAALGGLTILCGIILSLA